MEFEDLNQQIEREARRVAAAFGIESFEIRDEEVVAYVGLSSATQVCWNIDSRTNSFFYIEVGERGCEVNFAPNWSKPNAPEEWRFYPNPAFHEVMARGLYRLGFEDEGVLAELNHPLSAHEKLELRLSMPRELWPKTWLDEEEDGAK